MYKNIISSIVILAEKMMKPKHPKKELTFDAKLFYGLTALRSKKLDFFARHIWGGGGGKGVKL